MHLPTLISWTTIISEKSHCYPFPIRKHKGPNLTLPLRSTQGQHFNKLGTTWTPDDHTKFQCHRPFGSGEDGQGGHLGHVTRDKEQLNKLSSPHPKEEPYEIWLQSGKWLQRRRSLKLLTHIHTYDRDLPILYISSPVSLRLRWAKQTSGKQADYPAYPKSRRQAKSGWTRTIRINHNRSTAFECSA